MTFIQGFSSHRTKKVLDKMAAVVTILDHVMLKIDRCAILKPLEYPAATKQSKFWNIIFSGSKMAAVVAILDPSILKMNRLRPLMISMTHVKFQGNRTSTFWVITQRRFRTRWPPWWPSWITWCQKSLVVQYWSLWSTLKPKSKQILKLNIFQIQDGRRSGHLGSQHSENE